MGAPAVLFDNEIIGDSSPFSSDRPVRQHQIRPFASLLRQRFALPSARTTGAMFDKSVKQVHHSAPSPVKDRVRPMEPATTLKGRTSPERERVSKAHTAERVSFALQAWGRDKSAPIARVQQIAGVDRKTAAAWYRGKSPPQSEHLLTLARRIPELQGEVARLMSMDPDQDPRAYGAFLELMRMVQQR